MSFVELILQGLCLVMIITICNYIFKIALTFIPEVLKIVTYRLWLPVLDFHLCFPPTKVNAISRTLTPGRRSCKSVELKAMKEAKPVVWQSRGVKGPGPAVYFLSYFKMNFLSSGELLSSDFAANCCEDYDLEV